MHFLTAVVAALGFAGTSLAAPSLVVRDEPSAVVDDVVQAPLPTVLLSKLLDGTAGPSVPLVSNDTSPNTLAARNSWHLTTYFPTSCQGNWLGWTTGDGNWCVLNDGTDWHSLRVDNFGGCSTKYFSGRGCSGGVQVTHSGCWGFSQAEPIRAFEVRCPGRK
ncbi:hypothetical protein MAPG_05052 [Magnaporthiopsis poae ATCC 64411]|uniref:Uncharacterized protein n=1 Tax=Magnaporthiopsis poae (strain ATCC 64411 / 73-15) TaxID=644358 RepID=A0A0C4DYD4_MAGP6|nr:hypothetical protein MAPG_05052 [Magnaporthiopsis poae ATCC 64411]